MDSTERLSLPFIMPGQAQKEICHNEALQILDTVVACAVEDVPMNDPPASPAVGKSYLLGDAPSGEWSNRPGHIAAYTSAGWRFIAPAVGMQLFVKTTAAFAIYSTEWEIGAVRGARVLVNNEQVVGGRAAAIADPSGGPNIDAEARAALLLVLATLRQHGLIHS